MRCRLWTTPENTFFGRIFTGAGRSGADDEEPSPGGPNAWQAIIDAAEAHYEPGAFTTFIGYEFTAFSEGRGNLHRNVIFLGEAPPAPFTVDTSQDPEDLWQWLDELRAGGIEALAIPHNSNGSNGHMFKLETVSGQPLDAAYAEQRTRNEPLVEITQIKGTSDTHPLLSPNDEWADFEIYAYRIGTTLPSEAPGSYVREAYRHGQMLQETPGLQSVPLRPDRLHRLPQRGRHAGGVQLPRQDRHRRRHAPATRLRAARPTAPGRREVHEEQQPLLRRLRSGRSLGGRRTPASRSTARCAARRPSPPRARASGSASLPATTTASTSSPNRR